MAETLPPLTTNDIKNYLNDDSFTVYLYIGEEGDQGWDNARLAYGVLPKLRIYLVREINLIEKWVENEKVKGIVFGWDDKRFESLDEQQANDFKIVLTTIQKAR
jgi:hypothetical protein